MRKSGSTFKKVVQLVNVGVPNLSCILRTGFQGHVMRCAVRRRVRDTKEIHGGGKKR